MHYYRQTTEATLESLKTSEKGLSSREVSQRLMKYGDNRLRVKGEPLWRIILEPFLNVFVVVLVAAAALSLATQHTLDAIIIGTIIGISATIYYVQRFSTERVLRALKKHDVQMVNVQRDGVSREVPAEQLVPGDIMSIGEGEKLPADARLIHADNVRTNEAMLTGESLPISKHVHALGGDKPVYEQSNMLFQGSYIVSGRAIAVVTSTAAQTEFGRLASLAVPDTAQSPAQAKIDYLIARLVMAIGLVSIIVLALALWRGMEIVEALRFIMAMAVSAVPEGMPVAITVILVLGMRRLAKYKALARSMKAIENIGIITTIASDKTGTLTKNKLSVQEVWQPTGLADKLADWAIRAANKTDGIKGDPLDMAINEYAHRQGVVATSGRTKHMELPFDQAVSMSGIVWRVGDKYELVIKGVPEKLIQYGLKTGSQEHTEAEKMLHHFTGLGYRVIALGRIESLAQPIEAIADAPTNKLQFIGLMAIADELRPEAQRAIAEAQGAGISVRMITGDHAETAFAIGKKLGLAQHREQVLDCRTLDKMSDIELVRKVADTRVFARVLPEAKHRILSVLKQQDITAMTGDGVNDVPALTNAHVGIAMGSGSQIAKEAGDIVLLDDNFASIIKAVRGGRTIFDNIRRMLFYLLATSLGEVLVMIGALIAGLPLPVVAVQILWINLVTDTAFVIPLGLEPAESNVMQRPPRGARQPILDRHLIIRLVIIALTMAITTLILFAIHLKDNGLAYAQTIAFASLVVAQWANAFNARSEWGSLLSRARVFNLPMLVGFVVAFVLQMLVLFGPLAGPLHVVPVGLGDLLFANGISMVVVLLAAEVHKYISRDSPRRKA